jgi:hypothetical protein
MCDYLWAGADKPTVSKESQKNAGFSTVPPFEGEILGSDLRCDLLSSQSFPEPCVFPGGSHGSQPKKVPFP